MKSTLGLISLIWLIAMTCHRPAWGIVGGRLVEPANPVASMMVLISGLHRDTQKPFLCTGTFISKRYVLSAGHCLNSKLEDLKVLSFLQGPHDSELPVTLNAIRVALHPAYKKGDQRNDLGLIQIEAAPQDVQWALLPLPHGSRTGAPLLAFGFGRTHGSQIDSEFDLAGAGRLRQTSVTSFTVDEKRDLLIADQTTGAGVCHGDSGAPLLQEASQGVYTLWAVASAILPPPPASDDPCQGQAWYSPISSSVTWIQSEILN